MSDTTNVQTVQTFEFYDASHLLVAGYEGSDYRFGVLDIAEKMGEGSYPDHMVAPPDSMAGEWFAHADASPPGARCLAGARRPAVARRLSEHESQSH